MIFALTVPASVPAVRADSSSPASSAAPATTAAQKAELQAQLQALQDQITQLQGQLSGYQGQQNTLQNKIRELQNQENTLNLQTQATNLQITQLDAQIAQTQQTIAADQQQVADMQSQIAGFIELIHEQDDTPLAYTIFSGKSLGDVFDQIENDNVTSQQLAEVSDQVKSTEVTLNQQIAAAQSQQDSAQNFLNIQALQQGQLADTVSEQNQLLQQTKGHESDYQIAIDGTQAQASQIEAALYQLAGGATANVTFGQAAQIASTVSTETGVDEPFLLAILTQESNLGQNVGTCNRAGDPPSKSYKVIMKPTRDIQPFLAITSQLGLDPDTTPVSCPLHDKNGNQVGWGGAMGPAQFIPSTWVGWAPRISAITGQAANPWDINDAFIAAGLKLKADGADGTYQGDWNAAMIYFSGGTNSAYSFYGDDVMAIAAKYQSELATISQ